MQKGLGMSGEGRESEPIAGIKTGKDDGTLKKVEIVVSSLRIPKWTSCELQEVESSQLVQQLLLHGMRKEDHRLSSIYPQIPPPFLHQVKIPTCCHVLPCT